MTVIAVGGERTSEMATRVIGLVAGLALLGGVASAGSLNGSAGAMPAFYDGTLFSINFKELPAGGGGGTPAQKGAIKTIYMCDEIGRGHGWTPGTVKNRIPSFSLKKKKKHNIQRPLSASHP